MGAIPLFSSSRAAKRLAMIVYVKILLKSFQQGALMKYAVIQELEDEISTVTDVVGLSAIGALTVPSVANCRRLNFFIQLH